MLITEEDVEGNELADEVVADAVPEIPDTVHSWHYVGARRVDGQTYRCHPSVTNYKSV